MTRANWIKPINQNAPQCGAGDTKMQRKWHQTAGRMCKWIFRTSRSIRFLLQLHVNTTIIGVVIDTSSDVIARAAREKSGKVMRKREESVLAPIQMPSSEVPAVVYEPSCSK